MTFLQTIKGMAQLWAMKGIGGYGNIYSPYYNLYVPKDYSTPEQLKAYTSWVYKAVSRRSEDLSSAPPFAHKPNSKGEYVHVGDADRLGKLLAFPNKYESGKQFWYKWTLYMDLTGNCFIWKVPNKSGGIAELQMLSPETIQIVAGQGEEDIVREYIMRLGTLEIHIPASRMIHGKLPNPRSYFWGASPIAANGYSIDLEELAQKYQASFLKTNPQSKVVITSDNPINDAVMEKIKASIKASHTDNAYPYILPGMDAKALTNTNSQEVNYLETRTALRDDILTIYGVPASVLGISENVNRSNAEAAHYTYARYSLEPTASLRDDALQHGLSKEYPGYLIGHRNLIPENEEQELKEMETLLRNGVITVNEVRAGKNLDPIPGGDEPTIEANRTKLTLVGIVQETTPSKKSYVFEPMDDTEIKAAANWKAVLMKIHAKFSDAMYSDLVDYFQKQEDDFFARLKGLNAYELKNGGTITMQSFGFDDDVYNEALRRLYGEQYEKIMPDVWAAAMEEIKSNSEYPLDEEAIKRIMAESTAKITKVNETTQKEIKQIIEDGISEGKSVEDISADIKKKFEEFKTSRCDLIASLTVMQTINGGLQESFNRESDIVESKEWGTVRDGKVRKLHIKADGEKVPMNAPFVKTGEPMMYPCDPRGSIKNIAGCRCVLMPVLRQEKP